jgi:lipopolysaccharide export system protein LptC
MNNRASTWFPLALMLLLAALTYWLELTVSDVGGARPRANDSNPDFIVDNFRVTRTNQAGLPDYVLAAPRLLHFRGNDITEIEGPSLTHYAPGSPPVHLDAARGVVTGNGDLYEFFDKVVLRREPVGNDPALVMHTDYLKVMPDRALASTDRAVTITQGDSVLTGIGLEVDNNTRILHMLSEVRGTFHRVPKK